MEHIKLIIIYGKHSIDWELQLDYNNSNLWKNISIKNVLKIDKFEILVHILNIFDYLKIYLIPLMEINMIEILNSNIITQNIKLISSNLENINILHNKKLFFNYFKNNNLLKYLPKHFETISEIKIPYIIKPFMLNNGNGIKLNCNVNESTFDKYIIQKYIIGKLEYVSHIYSNNGNILKIISYEYLTNKEYYIKTNNFQLIKINKIKLSEHILIIIKKIIKKINYTGFCNIGYKFDNNNNIKILEINPRLGGSLMFKNNVNDLSDLINISLCD